MYLCSQVSIADIAIQCDRPARHDAVHDAVAEGHDEGHDSSRVRRGS
jgi:hypothetical protein